MSKLIDLTGKHINRWTILYKTISEDNITRWASKCNCGNIRFVTSQKIRTNGSKSCGCLKIELNNKIKSTPAERKLKRKLASMIKDKTPERKKQKNKAQLKYQISDKAALAQFRLWARKKNKTIYITDEQYVEFRKNSCHNCEKIPERTGVCFMLFNPRGLITLENMNPTCGICKLIKPKNDFSYIKFSCSTLRRYWKKTPMASIARQKARKAIGRYECNKCKNLFSDKDGQLDHINPVVEPLIGFVDLNTFASRLFCDESNLQFLCTGCHSEKTQVENKVRRAYKKENKK